MRLTSRPRRRDRSPGSNIIWDNQDNALHTAISGDPQTVVLDGLFDTGYVMVNQQSDRIPCLLTRDIHSYERFHPFLTGTVIVNRSEGHLLSICCPVHYLESLNTYWRAKRSGMVRSLSTFKSMNIPDFSLVYKSKEALPMHTIINFI